MKSISRIALPVISLVAIATLLECGGGSSQKISLLTITTATLPNGTAGTEYTQSIQASGGAGSFQWSLSAGTLPHNLQLNQDGTNTATISGMPDTPVHGDAFTVKVTDAANQSTTQPYSVSIMGLLDTLTLSPASLTFNPQLAGTTSATQTATITNLGSVSIAINSVVPTGNNPGDFSQTNTCHSVIAPNSSCEISVTFTPVQPGPRVASLSVNDDTNDTPHQLGLNGIGITSGPNATLSATSLAFNGQEVGTTSPAQTLTLTNYGEATLNIAGIDATSNFLQNSTCTATLAPAASCPINVAFSPSATGPQAGTLSVTDNLSGSPQTVALSGSGATSGTPVLTGQCAGVLPSDPNQCVGAQSGDCPAGEAATSPTNFYCGTAGYVNIDNSRACTGQFRTETFTGRCATAPATSSSTLSVNRSCQSSIGMERRSAQ